MCSGQSDLAELVQEMKSSLKRVQRSKIGVGSSSYLLAGNRHPHRWKGLKQTIKDPDVELANLRTDHDAANAVYEARVNIRNEALETGTRDRHSRQALETGTRERHSREALERGTDDQVTMFRLESKLAEAQKALKQCGHTCEAGVPGSNSYRESKDRRAVGLVDTLLACR
jgi:hypothetical protein